MTYILNICLLFTNELIDTIEMGPLSFWRHNQHRFPAIAALARDVLSIPATGAGVERLFNTARDVCHYRRGRMKSETIQELMMFLCTSRFDLEEHEAKRLEAFFTREEIEAAKEEKEEKIEEIELDPISDTEEHGDEMDGETEELGGPEDKTIEPQLPEISTQLRLSRRSGKRKQRDDDIFEYH
jgi:hAT family protein